MILIETFLISCTIFLSVTAHVETKVAPSNRKIIRHSTGRHIEKQLRGYRLTTAEVIYHLPDHLSLLQAFIWQIMDIAPNFPLVYKFLDQWEKNLDGQLHSVKVMSASLIKPAEINFADFSWGLQ